MYNGENITRNRKSKRMNVIGDIRPNGTACLLYKDGGWHANRKLGLFTEKQ
ncbi:hypothetical protein [Bacillus sp. JJ722]|uniref:hypothetical protein n=1 Tax=Bacillus sp. JJ722 TaxID=3122973 RepID=UPI002FFD9CC9